MIVPKMNVDVEDLVAAGKPDEKSTRAARSVCRYCSQSSSGKLYASFSDFATILHHYFATSAFFQKSKKHLPAALLLLKFNLPKI